MWKQCSSRLTKPGLSSIKRDHLPKQILSVWKYFKLGRKVSALRRGVSSTFDTREPGECIIRKCTKLEQVAKSIMSISGHESSSRYSNVERKAFKMGFTYSADTPSNVMDLSYKDLKNKTFR